MKPQRAKEGHTGMLVIRSKETNREDLHVPVLILKIRQQFGRRLFLVSPVNGSGQQWVTEQRLTFQE